MSPFLPKQPVISGPLPRLDGDSISTQHSFSMIITLFLFLGAFALQEAATEKPKDEHLHKWYFANGL